jgi:hypothetical protein
MAADCAALKLPFDTVTYSAQEGLVPLDGEVAAGVAAAADG